MILQVVDQINQLMLQQPMYVKWLIWSGIALVGFIALYLLLTIIFSPLMLLYNKWTDKNKSNALKEADYLIGELTTRILGDSVGEVMEIGSKTAVTVYPAKLYRAEDRQNKLLLPQGTKVLIIEVDQHGVAFVVKSNHFGE